MATLRFAGISLGAALTISVSAGALTAGPTNFPAWGQSQPGGGGGGGNGGPISITLDRSTLRCAPDSVRFSVDLSGADFDTPAPVGAEIYDARMHDLIYLWDFGDSGQWSAPVNVLAEWKNRTAAKGPWVSHVYRTPGTYTASVLVIEPASGKTATTQTTITVADPDVAFAASRTICLNPVGDGDFTGTPPGAVRLNTDSLLSGSAPWTTYANGANPVRWLFKRGASYTVAVDVAAAQGAHMMFGAYGSGPRPVLNGAGAATPSGASHSVIYFSNQHIGSSSAETPDARFDDLDFQGNHTPATQNQSVDHSALDWHAVKFLKYVDAVFHNCRMEGFAESTLSDYTNDNTKRFNIHLDNCVLSDFGGQYPIILQPELHPLSSFSMTGTRHAQNPNAVDDAGIRAPVRINHIAKTYVAGCDVFHTDRSQPCLKMIETPQVDGAVVNLHSCSLEGGLRVLTFGLNGKNAGLQRSSVHNAVVDGLVLVGNYGTQAHFKTAVTGVTVRNVLMIQPATPHHGFAPRHIAFFDFEGFNSFDAGIVGAAPIRIYNCTMRSDRSSAQNSGDLQAPVRTSEAAGFSNISAGNNILHGAGMNSLGTAAAPLSETVLWTPRGKGFKDPDTLALDASLAPPADAVKDSRPMIGSPALGAALSGDVSYMDITLTDRPEPPSQGAWEAV